MNNNTFKRFCKMQFINDIYNIENLLVFCKKMCMFKKTGLDIETNNNLKE